MKTVFNLNDVPAAKRFSHFRDVVETFYIPIGIECDEPGRFNAWVDGNDLGDVSIGTCHLTMQSVSRRRDHIRRSEDDRIKLVMPVSGAIASHQDKNDAVIRSGGFYITDPVCPYEERIIEDMTFVYMLIPRKHVAHQIENIERITATPFTREFPYGQLASDFYIACAR